TSMYTLFPYTTLFRSQDFLAESRRAFGHGDLKNGMVYAIGEEVTIYSINGVHMPMLKMRVEENGSAVYVPLPEMGANYRHSASRSEEHTSELQSRFDL